MIPTCSPNMTADRAASQPVPALAPFISAIVPVRNEQRHIESVLRQLLTQAYPSDRFEVIVADGQSTDRTVDVVRGLLKDFDNLQCVANPRRWSSAGRNAAIEAAQGDIILVVDGHCDIVSAEYLSNLADLFARSGADCVGRPQPLDVSHASPLQSAIAAARSSFLGHHPDSHIYSNAEQFVRPHSVAIAYRRAVFDSVGLFDEGFDACEDVEFNHRVAAAGFQCFFSPRILVKYHPRHSLSGLFWQLWRYGRGRMRLARKHADTFTLFGFAPAIFAMALLIAPLAMALSTWAAWAYAGALSSYVAVVLGASFWIAVRERSLAILPWLPPVFLAVHFGAGTGILWECMTGLWKRRDSRPSADKSADANDHPGRAP